MTSFYYTNATGTGARVVYGEGLEILGFIWLFEVAAGNDVVVIKKKYGKDFIIGGGIDKRALIRGKEDTREEVMSRVLCLKWSE